MARIANINALYLFSYELSQSLSEEQGLFGVWKSEKRECGPGRIKG